eukprot:gb/GECG01001077.1/.p1 GENE.gb/GECG01001077.1/~~gb/GECG01001077.1/.p1  ORF type:complete len:109 (+),score=3.22 gb/GECG01001077.1/:1-327(+)
MFQFFSTPVVSSWLLSGLIICSLYVYIVLRDHLRANEDAIARQRLMRSLPKYSFQLEEPSGTSVRLEEVFVEGEPDGDEDYVRTTNHTSFNANSFYGVLYLLSVCTDP